MNETLRSSRHHPPPPGGRSYRKAHFGVGQLVPTLSSIDMSRLLMCTPSSGALRAHRSRRPQLSTHRPPRSAQKCWTPHCGRQRAVRCPLVTVSPYANEPPRGTCRWKSGRRDRPPEGGAHRSAASDQTIGAGGWLIGPSVHARFTTLRDRDPMSCLSVRSGAGRPFEEISWGGR